MASSEKKLNIPAVSNRTEMQSHQLRQESEIHTVSNSKASFIDHFSSFAKNNVVQLIRFLFCIAFGAVIASSYFKISPEYPSANVLASSQILVSKGIKGVYPPLSGKSIDLYGKWRFGLISSQDDHIDEYQKYSIEFKKSGKLTITHKDCNSQIKVNWNTFSYNMLIFENTLQHDSELQILNEEKDVLCLKGDGVIWNFLNNVSIWTIHEGNLYLISQKLQTESKSLENRLLILERTIKRK